MESTTETATPDAVAAWTGDAATMPPPAAEPRRTPGQAQLAAALAADAASRGHAEFDTDTYFTPGPVTPPPVRVIGVHQ